ncbi:ABC transporter ATP-binding protein [Tepiditoga spiralis]|uniref:ABC transporter ATP-binding protein n=1 Tax=Tepiditoga spiralis TaxID=2108365 RepID=A0A7G1GAJ1_9BACT|nr:ABC transporter ATP-binding protein [Tepiditoga spiralis]BBE31172.1 ABC transporter ATP-binding protein [Tepiditoga spiralis]
MNKIKLIIKYILYSLKNAPLIFSVYSIIEVINYMTPAIKILVVAYFIDAAQVIIKTKTINSNFIYISILFFVLFFINYLINLISKELYVRLSKRVDFKFEGDIIKKSSKLKYEVLENHENYELIERIYENSENAITSALEEISSFFKIIVEIFSISIIILESSILISSIVFILLIFMAVVAYYSGEKEYDSYTKSMKFFRRAKVYDTMLNSEEMVDERVLFNYGNEIANEFENLYEKGRKIDIKITLKNIAKIKGLSFLMSLLAFGISASLLYILTFGKITSGMFISITGAVFNLIHPMSWTFSNIVKDIIKRINYMKDFENFMKFPEVRRKNSIKKINKKDVEKIEFKNVSFKYPNSNKWILKNLNFVLEKGKTYAFVGENGAGKTTIIKLMLGLYEDYEGEILINGKNQKNLSLEEWYEYFSVVYQDYVRYSISFEENIKMKDIKKCDDKLFDEVIKISEVKEVIEKLPEKEKTVLGYIESKGNNLSEGQWQKVAIARALYRNAPIQIFDEPTAALDPISERSIFEKFFSVPFKSMKILITHRLGGVKYTDIVLVFSNGEVIERGTHNELLDKRGVYYKMYEKQRRWYGE